MEPIIKKIDSGTFYRTYHGHLVGHLTTLITNLKHLQTNSTMVYLAGDSSLDNKFWLAKSESHKAVNDYQYVLDPPKMKADVCYHMNKLFEGTNFCAINCSIEESTIALREHNLLPQDNIIKEFITNNDILIVSVGGNDIALHPTMKTIWNMSVMMFTNSVSAINRGPNSTWGSSYFITMFRDRVREYILRVIGEKRPKKIIICMIYYPDEQTTGSWADRTLGFLGYNSNPAKLQAAIRLIFTHATSKIEIPGSKVIAFPMYEVLNGKTTGDYVDRVEPSSQGGMKLAEAFVKCCID